MTEHGPREVTKHRDPMTGRLHAYVCDFSDAIAYCAERGLAFDYEAAHAADETFYALDLPQAVVDRAMRLHIDTVCRLFEPRTYRWRHRILIALNFIFRFRGFERG